MVINGVFLLSGVYEETHGIVSNSMYDPVFDETFSMRTKSTKWWNATEPIWCYVKHFGLTSGSYYWPGDDTVINGIRPNKWLKYSDDTPFRNRVDDVMGWFTEDNFNFISLYFHEPDKTGHRYGPETPEVDEKVREMDDLLGYLVKKLEENKLRDKVNVIITSDHGMYPVDVKKKVIKSIHFFLLFIFFYIGRKEMFYLTTHSTHFIYGYMVKDHSDSEKGNPLPPHRLLFPISIKGSFICTISQTG